MDQNDKNEVARYQSDRTGYNSKEREIRRYDAKQNYRTACRKICEEYVVASVELDVKAPMVNFDRLKLLIEAEKELNRLWRQFVADRKEIGDC
jgi:hypothetical protein